MDCDQIRDDLLGALYGEADDAAIARVDAHRTECGTCAQELAVLRDLRGDLRSWTVPDAPTVVARVRPRRSWVALRWLPMAAGFFLALGAGLGLSGSELRFDGGRISFRLGRADRSLEALLSEVEARHASREADLRRQIEVLQTAVRATPAGTSEGVVLARVEDMIRESEGRQIRLLHSGLTDLDERYRIGRMAVLKRMGEGLSYVHDDTANMREAVLQLQKAQQR